MSLVRCLTRKIGNTLNRPPVNRKHLQLRYYDIPLEDIPHVTPAIIKKTLNSQNIAFEEGFACFITVCPICKNNRKSKATPKLYINKVTGFFSCPSCMHSGLWNTLEEYLDSRIQKKTSIFELANEKQKIADYLKHVEDNTLPLKNFRDVSLRDILTKFSLPVLPNSAIDRIDIRVNKLETHLYFPLENVESKVVGYKTLDTETKSVSEPTAGCDGVLVARLQSRSKETAILVSSIADFLALLNSDVSGNVICLPNGLINLPQEILPSLERFNKLILWFGSDPSSWDSARNFAKKLGDKRCLFIRPLDKQPLPHLAESEDLKAIVSSAQPIWHKSITTFSSLRQDVLSDLQNIDKVEGIKWKRYPTLNRILKGHRRGELTVITGPTGCGKTTFISEYSLDLALQGVNTLWGSFEIRNARLAKTMLQQMAGITLDEHLEQFDQFADQFEQLPIYFMTFHGQQSIKLVMEAVEHATYVHDIAHVIIDNVQFMLGMSDESRHVDRFWKQDTIVAAFRMFATRKNCHVTLVIHPRKEREDLDLSTSSIFGGAKASQEADNVLIIQDKRLTTVRGKKYLQVSKNRYSGDLGVMPLDFDKVSLSYAEKKKKPPDL